jgi:hypothetical protein
VDRHEQTVGQGRIGVRLTRVMALLRTVMRFPVRRTHGTLFARDVCVLPLRACLLTTIGRNAVCIPWSLHARSVAARAAPKDQFLAWGWPVSLTPGELRDSIHSAHAWLSSPNHTPWVKSEHFPGAKFLDSVADLCHNAQVVMDKPFTGKDKHRFQQSILLSCSRVRNAGVFDQPR